jgi:tetratricopeptide (TPR) repeat protein
MYERKRKPGDGTMRTIQTVILTGILSILIAGACGCQTPQEKKAAFKEKYNKTASPVKLTAAENMFEQGQAESAQEAVDDILKNTPDSAAAHTLRGRILIEQQQYGQARQAFEKAVSLDPQLSNAWFGLGVVSQSSDDHTQALEFYQKALEQNLNHTQTILAVVNTLEILNRRQEAAQLLDDKIAVNPSNTELLCAAADLANRLQQSDKAVSLYRRAATIQPKNVQILHALAMTYVAVGNWNNAADTFERLPALVGEDQQEEYLYRIADSSLNAGRYRRALECFDKLSVTRRNDFQVWLGMAISSLGVSDSSRAKICAQKALSFNSDCVEAQMVGGCADYLSGKPMMALGTFMPLMNHEKFGGFASFMASRCYEKMGRSEQAAAAFKKASELNPQSPLVAMFLNAK